MSNHTTDNQTDQRSACSDNTAPPILEDLEERVCLSSPLFPEEGEELLDIGADPAPPESTDPAAMAVISDVTPSERASSGVAEKVGSLFHLAVQPGITSTTPGSSAAIGASLKFNFQPANAPTIAGYLIDCGVIYGIRDGQSFGWSADHSNVVYDRNLNPDQRLDTLVVVKAASRWELAVPSGQYTVTVSVGDSGASSRNNIWIEGVQLFNYQTQATNVFSTKSLSVHVTDGKLTMGFGQAPTGTVRVNLIEVAGLPAVPPPVSPPPVSPPPVSPPILPPQLPAGVTLFSSSDTYVQSGLLSSQNFGQSSELHARAGDEYSDSQRTWLRFEISGAPVIGKATLRLYGKPDEMGTTAEAIVSAVVDAVWTEDGLTCENEPGYATEAIYPQKIGAIASSSTSGEWMSLDVTNFLTSQQVAGATSVTFMISGKAGTNTGMLLGSDESPHRPVLAIDPLAALVSVSSPVVFEGESTTLSVQLTAAPATTVNVTLGRVDRSDVDLVFAGGASSTTFSFCPENWNVPQTTQVYAVEDRDANAGAAMFFATLDGQSGYSATVTEIDNESPVAMEPIADAYVQNGASSAKNTGAEAVLIVGNSVSAGKRQEIYLSFDLSSSPTIYVGKIRLYGAINSAVTTGVQLGIFAAHEAWTESDVTWNNKPTTDLTPLAITTVAATRIMSYEWDVTSFLVAEKAAGRNRVTLVVRAITDAEPSITFRSDESVGGLRPQLIINGPKVTPPPLRIMPLGDSITEGIAGGYRNRLLTLLSSDYPVRAVDFVGAATNSTGPTLPDREHEGHGGFTISQIAASLDGRSGKTNDSGGYWFTGTAERAPIEPDVILLHIGTNDMAENVSASTILSRLDVLVDKITNMRPNALLLLSDLIVRSDVREAKSAGYGALIPALVEKYRGLGRHIRFVDMHSKVEPGDLLDSVHPDGNGARKMGQAWFEAIQAAAACGEVVV